MLCLAGEVRVGMENSSSDSVLKKGDYIHFYAEQVHSAINNHPNKTAKLFIIRFYQMAGPKTRPEPKFKFDDAVKDWMDLGRFAKQIREMRQESLRDLADRHRQVYSKDRRRAVSDLVEAYQSLEQGDPSRFVDMPFDRLAKVYKLPQVLLENYRYPAFKDTIVVRGLFEEDQQKMVANSDWRPAMAEGGVQPGYLVPSRNLLLSDTTIAVLNLEPGGTTPKNQHPGFELALTVRGAATVCFDDKVELSASESRSEFVHYASDRTHEVCNRSQEPCRVLVIRFASTWRTMGPAQH